MISAVVIAKNEEGNIENCLKNLNFCDEIIIIDDYSADNTAKIAKNFTTKIYKRHLNYNFAAQRNYGLTKASCEWILFVDADEIVSNTLKAEILLKISQENINGFYIKRRDIFLDRELKFGETGNVKLLRLAKKDSGKWKRKVHEYWNIKGQTQELGSYLIHDKKQNLFEFVNKLNDYSTLHAQENEKENKKSNMFKIVLYPFLKFVDNYFLKLGFLDGIPGFINATLMSFHSFLAWSKEWIY
ncbi:MAG TPA: glycosyltransferase family 2 protein [Patescibacteria group bacterium]|nr:glycosyltransferase family 2 protein [Patescibacteria group bacterium]